MKDFCCDNLPGLIQEAMINLRYRPKANPLYAAMLVVLAFSCPLVGQKAGGKVIYKLHLTGSPAKTIDIVQNKKQIEIRLNGFEKPLSVQATGGGTESCRTIISHADGTSKIVVSLPIATPNMPCQMTPGTISIEGDVFGVSPGEQEVAKSSGNDGQLRKAVEQRFGKIKQGDN